MDAKAGHLVRLWRPPLHPGEWRSIGLFSAADETELREVLSSLPLHIWMINKKLHVFIKYHYTTRFLI
jgi:muconolactone delta-isomerase